MQELIWFSIPGALVMAALWLVCPRFSAVDPALGIALAVVLGFVVHQTFRVAFELSGGWASRFRPVIREIRKSGSHSPLQAFLIWELTLYADDTAAAFRDHDRNAWHFVMSFWATALAAVLGGLIVMRSDTPEAATWRWGFAAVAVVFALKGFLTARSISQQEIAMLKLRDKKFKATETALTSTSGASGSTGTSA